MGANDRLIERAAVHAPSILAAGAVTWLSLQQGGQRPLDWLPVALMALILAAVAAARGPLPTLRTPAGIGCVAAGALTAWTGMSLLWTGWSAHEAWLATNLVLLYASAFVLGALTLLTAGAFDRVVAWSATAITGVGVATLVQLARDPGEALVGGRLAWPVGYPNGTAALFGIGALLLLGVSMAAVHRLPPQLVSRRTAAAATSGAALAAAGALSCLAILAQSRGALVAACIAGIVAFVVVGQRRLLAVRVAAVGTAVAASWPRLAEVFSSQRALQDARWNDAGARSIRRATEHADAAALDAVIAVAIVAVALFALGLAIALVELAAAGRSFRLEAHGVRTRRRLGAGGRKGSIAALAATLGLATTLAVADGRAADWVSGQWEGCRNPGTYGTPAADRGATHFSELGTNRCEFWSVGLERWQTAPLTGIGAGGFAGAYARYGSGPELPEHVHSLPVRLLAELGLVGLAVGGAVAGAVIVAASRFVRSGRSRHATIGLAIGAMGWWMVQGSLDWLWHLPAVTLPIALLAGGLVGLASPVQSLEQVRRRRSGRRVFAGAMLVGGALSLGAQTSSAVLHARAGSADLDVPSRLAAARGASRLDPSWAAPLLRAAALELGRQRPAAARRHALEAAHRGDREWRTQARAARLLRRANAPEASSVQERARALNPRLP